MFNGVIVRLINKLSKGSVLGKMRFNSAKYWEERYSNNGNSGAGSYDHLAEFKAEMLNAFVREHGVQSVIEFGCGDGNQLRLANYPTYIGYDVSPQAIEICKRLFSDDRSKSFDVVSGWTGAVADLSMSLDVIYHLVEDDVFSEYMQRLFLSSTRWVVIYSSDTDSRVDKAIHVRHRKFTEWVGRHQPGWRLYRHIPNKYPVERFGEKGSFAEFFIYQKIN